MQKPQPLATGFAFVFLMLLLAGLAARFWTSEQAYGFTGPTHIAAGDEHVYLFAAGDVYQLTHAGELVAVYPPDRTGLNDDPIDLRVTTEGQLLLAEQRPASIRLCDVDSWTCSHVELAAESLAERQFKILPGRTPHEWLMTDARGDTLWRLSNDGGPQKMVTDGALAGPNDLAWDDSGNLWVADTNHRQILELIPGDEGVYGPGRAHSAMNELTVGERFYPMMLARTKDGRWWVTQAAEFSEPHSDVLIYDPEEGVQALVDLPDDAYATDIVALDDTVLVTDLERFTVYQVRIDTLEVGEFGDETFRRRLAEIHESRVYYDRLGIASLAAVIVFAALMVLAAVWATPKERRWTPAPAAFDFASAPAQAPKTQGVHWLERDRKMERSLKWLEQLGFILFILMITGALVIYLWARIQAGPNPGEELDAKLNDLGIILLFGGVILGLMIPVMRVSVRAMKHRLGTDGKRLYIRLSDGRELAVDPSQLAYTNRAILYRKYTLPLLGGKQQPMYVAGEVETWLAPLLRQARMLTPAQAMKHQWKNQDGLIWWSLAAAGAIAVVLIVITQLND